MIAREIGFPLPRFAAWINAPAARHLANKVDADARVEEAIARVPEVLDHADELIAAGVIGGDQPNAADFQIVTSLRALLTIGDLRAVTDERPATILAKRFLPEFGNDFPPGLLPTEWLGGITGSGRS
jgi:glutathione S-transferase